MNVPGRVAVPQRIDAQRAEVTGSLKSRRDVLSRRDRALPVRLVVERGGELVTLVPTGDVGEQPRNTLNARLADPRHGQLHADFIHTLHPRLDKQGVTRPEPPCGPPLERVTVEFVTVGGVTVGGTPVCHFAVLRVTVPPTVSLMAPWTTRGATDPVQKPFP